MTTFRLFDGLGAGIERALDLRQTQHTLSAANLANVDTPGYQAREVPFADVLGRAVDEAERGNTDPASADIRELDPVAWAVDRNSVSAEAEAVKLTENSLMYNALATGMSRRLALLRFAASDGKA